MLVRPVQPENRTLANARHAVRDRDARQAGTIGERTNANARHTAIGRDNAVLTTGDQGFAVRPDQAISIRMVNGILCRDRDARQAGAIPERLIANARHAVRDRDARQAGATGERKTRNTGCSFLDRYGTGFILLTAD